MHEMVVLGSLNRLNSHSTLGSRHKHFLIVELLNCVINLPMFCNIFKRHSFFKIVFNICLFDNN